MNKLFTFLLLSLFLISFTSALDLSAVSLEKIGVDWDNVDSFTKTIDTSVYGKYEIRNSVLGIPFLQLSKVADIELKANSDICGMNCFAEKEITLYNDGVLIDDIVFKTEQEDGSWIYQPIRSYQFKTWDNPLSRIETSYKERCSGNYTDEETDTFYPLVCEDVRTDTTIYYKLIDTYKTVCVNPPLAKGEEPVLNINGTIPQICSQVFDKQVEQIYDGYTNYEMGEVVKAGDYNLRLEGEKKPSRTVDWIVKTNGIWTDEWAVWGNISAGDDAEVILNSPTDNAIAYNNPVTFSASAEVSGGATLTNVTLYNNISGTWEANGTTDLNSFDWTDDIVAYYKLDETSGTNVIDSTDNINGTNVGTATINVTGKINTAYDFDGTSDYINANQNINANTNIYTLSSWINFDSLDAALFSSDESNSEPRGIQMASFGDGSVGIYSGNVQYTSATGLITTNNWYYITYILNGTNSKIYVNGQNVLNASATFNNVNKALLIGQRSTSIPSGFVNGKMDEISIFSKALTSDEVKTLYNNGDGLAYNIGIATSSTQTFSRTITDTTNWNTKWCDSDGDCGFAPANFTVLLDDEAPSINITSPINTLDYNYVGNNETLNVTFTDTNLDSCWYNYNGTNISIDNCLTGVSNATNFTLESGNTNMTIYANDSLGNLNSTFTSWNYTYLENNRTHSSTSFETASETFAINVEGATSVALFYNGTEYTTTKSGNDYTRTLQMPVGQLGNHSVYWRFDDAQNSYTSYQNVSETIFTLCNTSYTTTFLNISFKDEQNLSIINAGIPTSTFNYWLGDGSVSKTYTFINISDNSNYEFCATPNRTLSLNTSLQYKQGTTYPQRTYSSSGITLTNATTNITLYLLESGDGIYQEFILLSPSGSVIPGVAIDGSRILEGVSTNVAIGSTDDTGSATFWLNPDFSHDFTFTKEGYDVFELTYTPTGQSKSIILGGGASDSVIDDTTKGITYFLSPTDDFLKKNTNYNFSYTISTSYWTLDSWGFVLKSSNGTVLSTQSSTNVGGGTLTSEINTTEYSKIIMEHYYVVNSTRTDFTRYWKTYATNEYSLSHLFERTTTYINADVFGILGDDNGQFSKALISVLIILLVVGGIIMRYGINNEATIMGMITGLLVFMNTIEILPNVSIFENAILSFGDLLVYVTMIMTIGFIIKGERF